MRAAVVAFAAVAARSCEVQLAAAKVALPARTSLQKDPKAEQAHWKASLENIGNGAQPLPAVPFMDPLTKSIVNPYLTKAVTGAMPIDTALSQASAALPDARATGSVWSEFPSVSL